MIFNVLTAQFREQERKSLVNWQLRLDADLSYMDEGIALMSISQGAKQRFIESRTRGQKNTYFLWYFRTARFGTVRFRRSIVNPLKLL